MDCIPSLDRKWGFLHRWCVALRGRLKFRPLDWDVTKENDDTFPPDAAEYLHVTPDYQTNQDMDAYLQMLREGLALLSVVAHVSFHSWQYIMTAYCRELVHDATEPPSYVLHLGDKVQSELIQFCGFNQHSNVSAGYQRAMTIIASLDSRFHQVEIQIPVRVNFGSQYRSLAFLASIHAAEVAIQKEWTKHQALESEGDILPPSLRCTFVLEPMVVDLISARGDFSIRELAAMVDYLVQENVRFSYLALHIKGEKNATMAFRQLVTALFDNHRRNPDQANTRYYSAAGNALALQLGALHLRLSNILDADFEALCSAMAFCQTTRTLQLDLDFEFSNRGVIWRWLAYGISSKTSRRCSVVASVTLKGMSSVKTNEMQNFVLVASSNHPEEALCGFCRSRNDEEDVAVKTNAIYRRNGNTTQIFPGGGNAVAMKVNSSVYPARTFGDNGSSEWVNVLIPGLGCCLVQRSDLMLDGANPFESHGCNLVSLNLGWRPRDTQSDLQGFSNFLRAIGPPLKVLTFDSPSFKVSESMVVRACPNLQTLWQRWGSNYVCFGFGEFHARKLPLPWINFQWTDLAALALSLSDMNNPAVQSVRSLSIQVNPPRNTDRRIVEAVLNAFISMLENNNALASIRITAPLEFNYYNEIFLAYHNKKIGQTLVPIEAMLAFMSVLSSKPAIRARKRARHELEPCRCGFDQYVMSKIFDFATTTVVRKVYFVAR